MKFNDFDKKMRVYEESLDQIIPPEVYIVARLDGRSFTRLTKQTLDLEKPFDLRFRDAMVYTVVRLMNAGFRVVYGYTQSDEISLLLHFDADTFSRKVRKLNSLLAAEASVAFSIRMSIDACFDCRIVQLPNWNLVEDYFLWRQEMLTAIRSIPIAIGRYAQMVYLRLTQTNASRVSAMPTKMNCSSNTASTTTTFRHGKNVVWVFISKIYRLKDVIR